MLTYQNYSASWKHQCDSESDANDRCVNTILKTLVSELLVGITAAVLWLLLLFSEFKDIKTILPINDWNYLFFFLQSKSAVFGNNLINMSQIKDQKYGCFPGWRAETRCLKTSLWGILGLGEIMRAWRTYAISSFTICDLYLIYWVINTSRWVWHATYKSKKCIQNLRRKGSREGPLGK